MLSDRIETALDSALVDQHEEESHETLVAEVIALEVQVAALGDLQAELEPYALRLEPEVVLYKSTPSLVRHAMALEKFLTIMRNRDA